MCGKIVRLVGGALTLMMMAVTAPAWAERGAVESVGWTGWTPRSSWVTSLDEASARRLLGAPRPPEEAVSFSAIRPLTLLAPEAFDWRSKDGVNWVTPMLNQGNCGSCVAFAAVATLETQMNIATGLPWLNPRYSTQALFACGGGSCDYGWYPSRAAQYLASRGVPDEACAPYTMGSTGRDVECRTICADSASRSTKIESFSTPSGSGNNRDAVKEALRRGPLMTTLTVYADFMTYGSGVYKHVTGSSLGGHAVSIVGFDDEKRAWIIRNSWGTEWGMNGFAYVSYDDISGIGRQTWRFEAAAPGASVSARNLRDRDYVSGRFELEASTNAPSASGLRARVTDTAGRQVAVEECASADCRIPLDFSPLSDGRYELKIEALGAQATSQPRFFFIANSRPVLEVDFRLKDGDISRPLRGRVEFVVSATSSTVPPSSLDFVVTKDGVEKLRRRADVVAPEMLVGWRTNLMENGTYELRLVSRVATNAGETAAESRILPVRIQN